MNLWLELEILKKKPIQKTCALRIQIWMKLCVSLFIKPCVCYYSGSESCLVLSDSLRPHRARLLWPWNFPVKNTGVGFPYPSPDVLPLPGIEPTPLMSPALAGGLFTTSATWEALVGVVEGKTDTVIGWFSLQSPPASSSLSPPSSLLAALWSGRGRGIKRKGKEGFMFLAEVIWCQFPPVW